MLRRGERPGPYTPKNDPERGQWFFVDPPAMARALGLPEDAPLVEIIREPPPAPGGGEAKRRPPTPMEILALRTGAAPAQDRSYPAPRGPEDLLEFPVMPRDHLNYAATWLTLSAAVGVMALRFLSGRGAGGAPRPPAGGGGGFFPGEPVRAPSTTRGLSRGRGGDGVGVPGSRFGAPARAARGSAWFTCRSSS